MTGKPVLKPVKNWSKFEFQNLEEKMAKPTRRTTDDETEGLVSGEAADVKSQTQIRLWAAAHQKSIEILRKPGDFRENRVVSLWRILQIVLLRFFEFYFD
jgi:hypothetical protein